jgi:epoxyqueuosine reductase
MSVNISPDWHQLAIDIKRLGEDLGFQQVGIADIDLDKHRVWLQDWLSQGYQGEMQFMSEHGSKRYMPQELVPGTIRIISVRLDYLPPNATFAEDLRNKNTCYISRYALGRDYHKLMRKRLKQFAEHIQARCEKLEYRPFVDSAPVLEHAIAEKAGIGWTGKHSLTINKQGGSWFFLGELFVNLPLPIDQPVNEQCGQCNACITICPTQAIVEPYAVDARRCISYLTIESKQAIPLEFRSLIGNRIYGCDDCQLICPWNRYAQLTKEEDLQSRPQLKSRSLLELFAWDEASFLKNTQGSPIRRIGYQRWQRNIAVALGNAPFSEQIIHALKGKLSDADELVAEHIQWAIGQQQQKRQVDEQNDSNRQLQRLCNSIEKGLPRDA